jgi:hypothetical protein
VGQFLEYDKLKTILAKNSLDYKKKIFKNINTKNGKFKLDLFENYKEILENFLSY